MPKETLRKGPYPGKPESMEDHEEPSRPPPYEIEEAFQAAFTQEIPSVPHTDDLEEEYARVRAKQEGREQPRAEQGTEQDGATEQNGNSAAEPAEGGAQNSAQDSASVTEARSGTEPYERACAIDVDVDDVPETLMQRLRPLAPWKRSYVTALMNLGGNLAMASMRTRVSVASVQKHRCQDADFNAACAEAEAFAASLAKASMFQSATIGDLEPIYRGPYLVGYKRVKSVKAAELILTMHGDLGSGNSGSTHITVNAKNAVVAPQLAKADLPALVADTVNRLIQANRGRPLKVVTEDSSEKGQNPSCDTAAP